MKLQFIRVRNFRNHTDTTLDCADRCNLLLGDNGQGKTNLLEAIAYLSLTKSVFGSSDGTVLAIGKDFFELDGKFLSDLGTESDVQIVYSSVEGTKSVALNHERVGRFSDLVGLFPIVVLSPEHHAITLGAPGDRRKFLDFVLSQASKSYLLDLLEYRRALRQRNRLLQDQRMSYGESSTSLDAWDEELVRYGSRIVYARLEFLKSFQPYFQRSYEELIEATEEPSVRYVSTMGESAEPLNDKAGVEQLFREALRDSKAEDARTGMTLIGPHRDDLAFAVNSLDARKYASQGQHKTLLIALKAAEFEYLRNHRQETPIMLLDDVFGELDDTRSRLLLKFLETVGQTFITAARDTVFGDVPDDRCRRFYISNGAVLQLKLS